jgi:hypothetical protein
VGLSYKFNKGGILEKMDVELQSAAQPKFIKFEEFN